jgi:hypothetical protein
MAPGPYFATDRPGLSKVSAKPLNLACSAINVNATPKMEKEDTAIVFTKGVNVFPRVVSDGHRRPLCQLDYAAADGFDGRSSHLL